MQAIADLRFLDLAQVGVEPLQQGFALGIGRRFLETEFLVQALAQHAGQHAFAQQPGALGIERQGLAVFVQLALELLQRSVGFGARHRRHQVVDDDGLGAALGLRAFAGVVDDEGVEVRQGPEDGVGPAGRAERHALAGQPLQVAVRAYVHYGIDLERAAQPEVEGEVVVGGNEVGVVVRRRRIEAAPAWRLDAYEDVAEAQAGDHEAAAAQHRVLFGPSPARVDGVAVRRRQVVEVGKVVGQRMTLAGRTCIVGVKVVGDAAHQCGDQGVAVPGPCRSVRTKVVAPLVQGLQNGYGRGWCVQPYAVGEACVGIRAGGRVVGQDQRYALVGIRLFAQHAPAPRQFGHEGHALGFGLVTQHVEFGALAAPGCALEADGAGDDAAIDFGQHHLHRQVTRGQAMRVGLPLIKGDTGGDELQHRGIAGQGGRHGAHLGAFERGHGEARRVQHHSHAVLGSQRLHHGLSGRVLQRIDRQRNGVQAGRGECGQHGVEHRRVAGLQVGAVEQQQRNRRAGNVRRGVRRLVAHCRRQRLRRRRPRAQTEGGMADQREERLRVVAPAFAQAAPEVAAIVVRCGAAQQQLLVFESIAREHGQPQAARACQAHCAFDHVGPIAGAAEVLDHQHAGVAQHVVLIEVDRGRLAQPHQIGQAHAGVLGAELGAHVGQQRQGGVGGAEHHHLARGLRHAHDALATVFNVAAGAGGKQVHRLVSSWSSGSR